MNCVTPGRASVYFCLVVFCNKALSFALFHLELNFTKTIYAYFGTSYLKKKKKGDDRKNRFDLQNQMQDRK